MRASSFSDERVIRLVSTYFVPIHVSRDNYLMAAADDATSRELQRIDADRRGKHFEGGIVAVYILDPDGGVRSTIPVQQAYYPDRFVTFLEKVIADSHAERRRPEDVRRTAAGLVAPRPPANSDSLALTVWTRTDGKTAGDTAVDPVDLASDEWSKLIPAADAGPGATWEVAERTADRLFLLCYPPGPHWKSGDNKIAERKLRATLVSVDGDDCLVRLEGRVKMWNPFSGKANDPYVVVTVMGYLHLDKGKKVIKEFNLASVEAATFRTWQGVNLPREPFKVAVGMRTP